jgi:hypothetical protein
MNPDTMKLPVAVQQMVDATAPAENNPQTPTDSIPCSTDSIPWVHDSREQGSLDNDGGFVHLQIHMNYDTIIHRQHNNDTLAAAGWGTGEWGLVLGKRDLGLGCSFYIK